MIGRCTDSEGARPLVRLMLRPGVSGPTKTVKTKPCKEVVGRYSEREGARRLVRLMLRPGMSGLMDVLVGVVDHVSCNPIGAASSAEAASAERLDLGR